MLVAFRKSVMTIATPVEDDDYDGVGDDGDAGEDGHDDAEERKDEVERSVELGACPSGSRWPRQGAGNRSWNIGFLKTVFKI